MWLPASIKFVFAAVTLISVIGQGSVFCQISMIDSLRATLLSGTSDSLRVSIYFRLVTEYNRAGIYDSARIMSQQAIDLAGEMGHPSLLAQALRKKADHFRQVSIPDSMAHYARLA
ncbi:MAG: hypothetical protein OEQ53_17635, partial [Saprospiraceae bacterium]|nr:hypothetical protein [Saprospiraceae bacterium]